MRFRIIRATLLFPEPIIYVLFDRPQQKPPARVRRHPKNEVMNLSGAISPSLIFHSGRPIKSPSFIPKETLHSRRVLSPLRSFSKLVIFFSSYFSPYLSLIALYSMEETPGAGVMHVFSRFNSLS